MCCDKCTQFEFYYDALIKTLLKQHKCGKRSCNNYNIEYGRSCKCVACTNCIIFDVKQISAYDLLDFVLCRSYSHSQFINCAQNKCGDIDCGIGKFARLLNEGIGCSTFTGQTDIEVAFKYIESEKVNNKTYKYIDWKSESYHEFRSRFLLKLEEYIYHQFLKRNQYYNRSILFTKANNSYAFPDNWLFISIDFISNYTIKANVITHNMSTSMGAVSHLVIHEKRIFNGNIKQSAYNFFSDQIRHGWYSAIPALKWYMKYRKEQLKENDNIDLRLYNMWSDGTSKDFWCAPTHILLSDVVSITNVPIVHNRTPSGHGKTYHDQIGGTTQTHMDRSTANGTFKLKQNGGTKSHQITYFLASSFNHSKSGDLDRFFIEIPRQSIYAPPKGYKTFDSLDIETYDGYSSGITSYYCALIGDKRLRYRALGCCCNICVNNVYSRQCGRGSYSGRWSKFLPVPAHNTYAQLLEMLRNGIIGNRDQSDNHNK